MNSLIPLQNFNIDPSVTTSKSQNPAMIYLAGLAASGRRSMEGRLRQVCQMVGHSDPFLFPWNLMRHEHVVAIKSRLVEDGKSPATVNTTLCALRGVARAAFNLGLMNGENYQRLLNVKSVRGSRLLRGRGLSRGELRALFAACGDDSNTVAGIRDAAILGLLYSAGLRRTSVSTLDFQDFNQETAELKIRGKGNSEYLSHITDGSLEALLDWISIRGDEDGALFHPINKGGKISHTRMTDQAIYNVLRKRSKLAKIKDCSPHDFRRSFVSDLLDVGVDIATVQRMANHASVSTTARYDRRGEETKRKAAKCLHVPYVGSRS